MPVSDQGVNHDHYQVVPRTLIFLMQEDKVLLLKGSNYKRLWSGLYNGVGGHIEQGEDVISAARRELFEETGLTCPNLWLCGIAIVDIRVNPGVLIFIFTGEFADRTTLSSKEGHLEWIKTSAIDQIPVVEDLPYFLPKIMAMKPGDLPFFAHSHYNEHGKMEVSFD